MQPHPGPQKIEVDSQVENSRMSIATRQGTDFCRFVFTSPQEIDDLIAELIRHRQQCWPWPPISMEAQNVGR
jgi:hypothetical protein